MTSSARDLGAIEIAFVDDDADLRDANAQALRLAGLTPVPLGSAQAALDRIGTDYPGVVVTDVRMPGMDGIELFRHLRALDPDIPVILISGHADIAMAVAAMSEGAYDFIAKPYAADRLVETLRRAIEKRALVLENRRLRALAADPEEESALLGETPAIVRLRQTIRDLADVDVDVLVLGETGTGKEVVASLMHRLGRRRDKPFVALNCGALPDSVIESELFGYEPGAFTGAQKKRVGRIEHSSGGTLFLDELESMPSAAQVKLLRVLEMREIVPLGSNELRRVDLRVVAATKIDLGDPAQRRRLPRGSLLSPQCRDAAHSSAARAPPRRAAPLRPVPRSRRPEIRPGATGSRPQRRAPSGRECVGWQCPRTRPFRRAGGAGALRRSARQPPSRKAMRQRACPSASTRSRPT